MSKLLCSACRETKPEDEFHRNRSSVRGRDTYCIPCRAAYRITGAIWPTTLDRRDDLHASGNSKCSACKEIKSLSEFHQVKGFPSRYCKACASEKTKEYYDSPEGRARAKEYYSRPEVKEREHNREKASPRQNISRRLNAALRRRPSDDAVTLDELMDLWEVQGGRCAVTGLSMTWKTRSREPTSISLDRIDSSQGYTKGNVRFVCWQINAFKCQWSDEKMIAMARAILAKADAEYEKNSVVKYTERRAYIPGLMMN